MLKVKFTNKLNSGLFILPVCDLNKFKLVIIFHVELFFVDFIVFHQL